MAFSNKVKGDIDKLMLIEGLLELIFAMLQFVFAPISIPPFPDGVQNVVAQLTQVLIDSVGLLGVFVDLNVLKWMIPIVIIVIELDKIWMLIMFILRKIPFVGIE